MLTTGALSARADASPYEMASPSGVTIPSALATQKPSPSAVGATLTGSPLPTRPEPTPPPAPGAVPAVVAAPAGPTTPIRVAAVRPNPAASRTLIRTPQLLL